MLALRRKINFAFTVLSAIPAAESVGVRLRNGELRYVAWGGFQERGNIDDNGVRFVKLDVYEYTMDLSRPQWVRMHQGSYVRGCLVPHQNATGYVAYAMTLDGELLIVN